MQDIKEIQVKIDRNNRAIGRFDILQQLLLEGMQQKSHDVADFILRFNKKMKEKYGKD